MNQINFLTLLVSTIVMIGCTNNQYRGSLDPGPEQGILLVSLSWSDAPNTPPGHEMTTSGVDFSFRNISSGKTFILPIYRISGFSKKADFTQTNTPGAGSFYAIALPPGRYEFYRWRVYQGHNELVTNHTPMSVPFTVKANVIQYLGELNLEIERKTNRYDYGVFHRGKVQIKRSKSSQERDFKLMAEKYPSVTASAIEPLAVTYAPQSYELYDEKNTAVLRDSRGVFHTRDGGHSGIFDLFSSESGR